MWDKQYAGTITWFSIIKHNLCVLSLFFWLENQFLLLKLRDFTVFLLSSSILIPENTSVYLSFCHLRYKSIPYPLDPRIFPPSEVNTFSFHESCFDPSHTVQMEPSVLCPRSLAGLSADPQTCSVVSAPTAHKSWSLKIAAKRVSEEHFGFNKLMIKPRKEQWVIGKNAESTPTVWWTHFKNTHRSCDT